MEIIAGIIIFILMIFIFVFNTKYSIGKKILMIVIALTILFTAMAFILRINFDSGRDRRMNEELKKQIVR
ncbi:MAG: hypothetical protein ABIP95_10630 [Pelobium sp.]